MRCFDDSHPSTVLGTSGLTTAMMERRTSRRRYGVGFCATGSRTICRQPRSTAAKARGRIIIVSSRSNAAVVLDSADPSLHDRRQQLGRPALFSWTSCFHRFTKGFKPRGCNRLKPWPTSVLSSSRIVHNIVCAYSRYLITGNTRCRNGDNLNQSSDGHYANPLYILTQ